MLRLPGVNEKLQAGPAAWTRLGLRCEAELNDQASERAWAMHERWVRRRGSAFGDLRKVCEHAVERLEMIMEYLEEHAHA